MSSTADTTAVIETAGLRKVYRTRVGRRVVAVDDLDLVVPAGGVHGFLGPNGSGKTTTIRLLLGLARASRGEMRLFGEQVPARLPAVMDRIGAVVEEPTFVPTFSGRRNLQLLARPLGIPHTVVDEAIRRVGLEGRDRDRYAGYSLGMRQRLAIAATLLKSPDLLILDEPTNGLDPAGIRDIREMIRGLGASGVTVLLSSHILAEVQQVCDSVSIIGNGRLLASGRVEDLVGDNTLSVVRVWVANPDAATGHLAGAGYRVSRSGDHLDVEGAEHPEDITRELARHGLYVRGLTPVRGDLEEVFLQLTSDASLGGGPVPGDLDDTADAGHTGDTDGTAREEER